LPELAEQGRIILQTSDDEYVHHELARTLLAIPAMPEAVAFLEEWIAKKGPNLERLGMLAWAKGCVADYEAAESLWRDELALAEHAEPDEILRHVPFVAYTLVDCFAAAGELPRAQRVARQAWERCRDLAAARGQGWFSEDTDWMMIFRTAELDVQEVARFLLAHPQSDAGPKARAESLCVRGWVDAPEAIVAEWLDWVRERIEAREWSMLRSFRYSIARGLYAPGEWRAHCDLAQAIWELLGQADAQEAEDQRSYWDCRRDGLWAAVLAKDWAAAEEMAGRVMRERGIQACGSGLVYMAVMRGLPTPPEVVKYVEEKDTDSYDLYDWYVVAREAAADGDEAKAFAALRKAVSYWTNSPYGCATDNWEKDLYWGKLRDHPEFKCAFDERRRRIGPVYGHLHYFPGW
jgi:hypothetical protein